MVTVRASTQGLLQIDRARRRNGWLKQSEIWCRQAQTSRATLKRFWRRDAIDQGTFIALCQAVGLADWQSLAEPEPAAEITTHSLRLCLAQMPEGSCFLGRDAELNQLTTWSHTCRLLVVWGLGGMGKTALVAEWVEAMLRSGMAAQRFEAVVWRSLHYQTPSLTELAVDIARTLEVEVHSLTTLLQQHRVLLILDGWETLLSSAVGQIKPEYADFSQWLQQLANTRHSSCLVLVSREKPAELARLQVNTPTVQSHKLQGLATDDAICLLQQRGLKAEPDAWQTLVQLYRGHPLALNLMASLIHDICQGSTAAFLAMNTLVIHQLDQVLAERVRHLSTAEREILRVLAQAEHPYDQNTLRQGLAIAMSQSQVLEQLVALGDRGLLETLSESETVYFTLTPVVQKYIRQTISTGSPAER
jgi:DNA-binding transcriptional ArsR family regulator